MTSTIRREDLRYYGAFGSPGLTAAAVRVLNDLLGLRDCADRMPLVFPGQGDLFDSPAPMGAACPRYDLSASARPRAGLVGERDYRRRVDAAAAFLELRSLQPLDREVEWMNAAAERQEYEAARRWREKFEQLEWLLAAIARARVAIQVATFVYRDPGIFGDERAYLIRHGVVCACYPFPTTPIEQEAFRAVVAGELARPLPRQGLLEPSTLDQRLLVLSWFRRHPEALRRTSPLEQWVA